MKDVFLQILSLSLSAALIAALVMLLRLVLKKSPRFLVCALWALVAVRLLIPALPESQVSLIPQPISSGQVVESITAQPVEPTVRVTKSEPRYVTILQQNPRIPVRYQGGEAYVEVSQKTLEAPKTVGSSLLPVLAWIWLGGVILMLAYMAFSYGRIGRRVRVSLKEGNHIYICDHINTPFILGLFRPRIYLPSALTAGDRAYVLAHEQAHLKRLDHVWKPLGFLLLAVHWFNPLMWAAYILLCRDIEMACDEKVTGREDSAYRRAYSRALLACSAPVRMVSACPLAFGEVGVKTRVKSLLHYKKPAFWILAATLLACAVAAGCALTNPPAGSGAESEPGQTSEVNQTAESTAPSEPASQASEPGSSEAEQPGSSEAEQPSTQEVPLIPGPDSSISYRRASLENHQDAFLLADRLLRWEEYYPKGSAPMYDFLTAWPIFRDNLGPNDQYVDETGYYLLDRAGLRLIYTPKTGPGPYALSIDYCNDPLLLQKAREEGSTVFYVLDEYGLYRLPRITSEWESAEEASFERIDLPSGLKGSQIRDMLFEDEIILITDEAGNYRLKADTRSWEPTQQGYRVSRSGEDIYISTQTAGWVLWAPYGEDVWVLDTPTETTLTVFMRNPSEKRGTLYRYEGSNAYVSLVDMSGWCHYPARYIRMLGDSVYVMTSDWLCCETLKLEPGVSFVQETKAIEDMSSRRAEILSGRVVPLHNGQTLNAVDPGFYLDMDGDGLAEEISFGPGLGNHNAYDYEIYVNGKAAGSSLVRYRLLQEAGETEMILPDGGTFARTRPFKLYLASLDGVRISLFLENEEQTYGLDFYKMEEDEGHRHVTRTRIRGYGKTMADFVPGRSAADYVAAGWRLSPADGDRLDLNGDGQEDSVHLTLSLDIARGYSLEESIAPGPGESLSLFHKGSDNIYGKDGGRDYGYGELYYAPGEKGGYDILGELSLNGHRFIELYHLTDSQARPLEPGEDLSRGGYRHGGSQIFPLRGWEALGPEYKEAFYSARERVYMALSIRELEELRSMFEDQFIAHFLLEEYEDVRDIDLRTLFFDGAEPSGPVRRGSSDVSEAERRIYLAASGAQDLGLPLTKVSAAGMAEAFRRFTGYPLSEARSETRPGKYQESLDAYYMWRGDSHDRGISLVDGYWDEDGCAVLLWTALIPLNDMGLVKMRKSAEGWQIVSNRFISREELASESSSLPRQAYIWAPRVLSLDYEITAGSSKSRRWKGRPINPVDFWYEEEIGCYVLDQAGKRLIHLDKSGATSSVRLDFSQKPSRLVFAYGGSVPDKRLYLLDGREVLEVKAGDKWTDPRLERRIPLPEGLSASGILAMEALSLDGYGAQMLLLVTQGKGNYLLRPGENTFRAVDEGWHMEREGNTLYAWLDEYRWGITLPEKDVQLVQIGSDSAWNGFSPSPTLTLLVGGNGAQAQIRQYDISGTLIAVSSLDLSDFRGTDVNITGHGEGGLIMADRNKDLSFYSLMPGLTRLDKAPGLWDYTFQHYEWGILGGEIIELDWMREAFRIAESDPGVSLEEMSTGFCIDMNGDNRQDTLSLQRSMDNQGRKGFGFLYNERMVGAYLNQGGLFRETDDPAFFLDEEPYSLYLLSLDGKKISLAMATDREVKVLELVEAAGEGGRSRVFARVRMWGVGKTMEDFTPCLGIEAYLKDGWLVRPSEGDVVDIPGAGEQIVHMSYRTDFPYTNQSFYQEWIRIGDEGPAVLLGASGDYGLFYERFRELSYAPAQGDGSYVWLRGRLAEDAAETIYAISKDEGRWQYRKLP